MNKKPYNYLKIQDKAKEDRPRERLISLGTQAMSNAELLAILIRTGTQYTNAVDLAQNILKVHNHSLNELAKRSIAGLTKFKGIGQAKALTIVSALELGNRRKLSHEPVKKITSSYQAYITIQPRLSGKTIEEFWTILLNRNNHVIKLQQISKGGIAQTVVDPKMVFKYAFEYNATGIILAHNHPSGNLKPSREDLRLTKKLIKGATALDINIFDHLIITDDNYLSFADKNML